MISPVRRLAVGGALVGCLTWAFAAAATDRRQSAIHGPFVAFRVGDAHAIAVLNAGERPGGRAGDSPSKNAVPRWGFHHFALPDSWRKSAPAAPTTQDWILHSADGSAAARAVEVVGGNAQCTEAIGVLLRIEPGQLPSYERSRHRYLIAESPPPADVATKDTLPRPPPRVVTLQQRVTLESTLNELLARELPKVKRELPKVRSDAGGDDRQRSRSRDWTAIDTALAEGRGRLRYDVQAFALSPDGAPLRFVRARWFVGGRQAFAASLWLRGDGPFEIIRTSARQASWLRSSLFRNGVADEHLGLVLNVTDRDGDGWGEVLFAESGYEAVAITVLKYSPAGFTPIGTPYAFGC